MTRQIIHIPLDVKMPPAKMLKAGKLNCLYENGNLRYIKCGDVEILRMVYGAVRDQDWNTIAHFKIDEKIQVKENSFSITYTAWYNEGDVQYKAFFTIEGTENSEILFTMKGEALSDFYRNRIGLCVHLPIQECAGNEAIITKPDHSSYTNTFPKLVSPHQPFLDIHEIKWNANGFEAQLSFDGEVFEIEDQRNWADYSYKIYGTPLSKPFPVQVKKGEQIEQKVSLKIIEANAEARPQSESIFEEKRPFPKTGFCRTKGEKRVQEVGLLQNLPIHHYRVELGMDDESWKTELASAAEEARLLYAQLELVVFFTDHYNQEIQNLSEALKPIYREVYSILPLHKKEKITPALLLDALYPVFKSEFSTIKIGYGTDAYFAELNRARPQTPNFDFVSFSLNPQVHASDERSIIENLRAQKDIVDTIRSFIGIKEIHVSPVTFGRRNNPDAISFDGFVFPADPRSKKGMGAAWILNSIFYLSAADRITYCQSFGKNGMIDKAKKSGSFHGYENAFSSVYEFLSLAGSFKPQFIFLENKSIDRLSNIILENKKGDRMVFVIDE